MESKKNQIQAALQLLCGILFLAGIFFVGRAIRQNNDSNGKKYTFTTFSVFDTKTDITFYASTQEEFQKRSEQLNDKLVYYHNLFDIYHRAEGMNNLYTVNENAGVAPVPVEDEMIKMLRYAQVLYQVTGGKTNIAMGSVLSLWHQYRTQGLEHPEDASLPPMELLSQAANHTDITKILIDEENKTVFLEDALMSIDVGSIAKGYVCEQLAEYAKSLGLENVLICIGGNIRAVGEKNEGTPWVAGIMNPDTHSDASYVATVGLKDGLSLVTSGDYQRYYEVDGKRYCHVIDPDTLYPADEFPSVSVIANDSTIADVFSTALFCMELKEGLDFVNRHAGVEAIWVLKDGTTVTSDYFSEYIY